MTVYKKPVDQMTELKFTVDEMTIAKVTADKGKLTKWLWMKTLGKMIVNQRLHD